MKYHIGDKFLVQGIETEVRFINRGKAWVAPLHDFILKSKYYFKCCTFEVLDANGLDSLGNHIHSLENQLSQAV